jgi:predicted LPLAT superfamily acyltransferase
MSTTAGDPKANPNVDSAAAHWTRRSERGSPMFIRLMLWIARHLGRSLARAVLAPVTVYFVLTGSAARTASRAYLRRVLKREPGWRDIYRHINTFVTVTLDRVYLLAGRNELFDIRFEGVEHFDRAYAQGRGVIMFGAHFGGFDVLRALAEKRGDLPVNILMHEANAVKIRDVLATVAPHLRDRVIALGQPETFLRVKELVDSGEVVGLLADRGLTGDKRVSLPFLDGVATWPLGPMLLASILKAPMVLFYAVYRGGNRYDIRVEPFAESITVARATRDADLSAWVERYARSLETQVLDAPYNWFNFYDFWSE